MSRQDERLIELERQVAWLRSRLPVPLAGTFLDTAATAADDLRVRAFGYDDGEHTFGPVRWSPMGGALPEAGDECVILERDDGVWQVVAWWSDSQGTGVSQSAVNALDTRLDALEAKRVVSGAVASDGSESSSEFSVVKNGTGDYTVTFTTAFASTPNVVVGKDQTGSANVAKLHASTPPTASVFRVFTFVGSTGTATDGGFTFIAHGPA